MRSIVFAVFAFFVGVAVLTPAAQAQQPVSGWYAKGQVWILFNPGANDVYEVYTSGQPLNSTTNMTHVGDLFPQEWSGSRLTKVAANGLLRIPAQGGGTLQLLSTQGVFVFTPHSAGTRYFAVVRRGSTVVNNGNRVQVTFGYDPVNEPVEAHWQFDTLTAGGNPCSTYVVWTDGAADENSGRPDFPIMGNQRRIGVPHVFCVTLPRPPDMLPATPYPCVVGLHGGEGEYQKFRPGEPERANLTLGLTNSIFLTPDDTEFFRITGTTVTDATRWLGYVRGFDPFDDTARSNPPAGDVVVNYTSRRVFWILDWLQRPGSGYNIDPQRVAVIGHSGGSWGSLHLSREAPERFSAAVGYSVPMGFVDNPGASPLLGQVSQNLATNLLSPLTGLPLGNIDVISPWVRISAAQRDFCYTRIYLGKRDQNGEATWAPHQRAAMATINTAAVGIIISWDEREHGVELWDTEDPDSGADPCNPWPDIGQWVYPVKTLRPSAQNLVDNYRFNQSYPGFFNTDEDLVAPGRQPDPGPGDPCALGWSTWGSWGGNLDWDRASLTDTATQWACTMFLVGQSAVSVDNALVAQLQSDVSIRRPQSFAPPAGSGVVWTLSDPTTNVVKQLGTTSVPSDGLVTVAGLLIPRDPARARLTVEFCPTSGTPPTLEATSVGFSSKTMIVWTPAPASTNSDVIRGLLNSFPVGPGGGDEGCLAKVLAGSSYSDPMIPAPGAGAWYLVRGGNACGSGPYGFQGVHGAPGAPRVTTTCP